jgi:hypothetical protein
MLPQSGDGGESPATAVHMTGQTTATIHCMQACHTRDSLHKMVWSNNHGLLEKYMTREIMDDIRNCEKTTVDIAF